MIMQAVSWKSATKKFCLREEKGVVVGKRKDARARATLSRRPLRERRGRESHASSGKRGLEGGTRMRRSALPLSAVLAFGELGR